MKELYSNGFFVSCTSLHEPYVYPNTVFYIIKKIAKKVEVNEDVSAEDSLRRYHSHVITVKDNIDWNLKESVRARMKVMVKRLLRQYGYSPDMAKLATELVLEQAQVFTTAQVR